MIRKSPSMTLGILVLWLGSMLAGCGGPSPRAYSQEVIDGALRVAIIPLANYTTSRDAQDRLLPLIEVELATRANLSVIDAGRVESAMAREPWLMTDRLPPDLVDRFGELMGADALLLGSVIAYGYRDDEGSEVPQVTLSLRLLETPGGRVLWSGVHSRDGADKETVFGFGRTAGLERLASETVRELLSTFPQVREGTRVPLREKSE